MNNDWMTNEAARLLDKQKYAVSLQNMTFLEAKSYFSNLIKIMKYDLESLKKQKIFWQIYWEKVCVLPVETVTRLLAFWFTLKPTQLPHSYVTQDFLMLLQQNLHHYQKLPEFQNVLRQMIHYPWFTAIQDSILVRKNAFLLMGQDLMKQVQKRLPSQKPDNKVEEQKRLLHGYTRKLFEKGHVSEAHLSYLLPVYQIGSPAQFWEIYKERLIRLLLSTDAEHALEFFSFWFDQSFASFAQQPFVAQSFFIGLPQVIELAGKENEGDLRKTSQRMKARIEQQLPSSYGWYALIQRFLPEGQTTEQHSHWFKR